MDLKFLFDGKKRKPVEEKERETEKKSVGRHNDDASAGKATGGEKDKDVIQNVNITRRKTDRKRYGKPFSVVGSSYKS